MTTRSLILNDADVRRALTASAWLVAIEPLPHWDESPVFDGSAWVGRYMKHYERHELGVEVCVAKPPYAVGDVVYVQEAFHPETIPDGYCGAIIRYKADNTIRHMEFSELEQWSKLRHGTGMFTSALIMPRWAARIWREVTAVEPVRRDDGVWCWRIEWRETEART